ncbi:hormone-sensitive lipase [Myzus persicae]|uniref:hormone-sensitive lipase n=1 Tax=Myzus persicae TaxID=13164 RepID=UPI000B938DCC|nr:hormone-sensitive lipase [Myzus persicae]XP_022178762.1 hormone-sensitive lipase [Myzus persicae]
MATLVEIDDSTLSFDKLKDLCKENIIYFTNNERNGSTAIANSFEQLFQNIDNIKPLVFELRNVCHLYDFDPSVPGNGYRSYITVVDLFIDHCIKICNQMALNRDSFFFRKTFYTKEIESCNQVMSALVLCLENLCLLIGWSEPGMLFAGNDTAALELMMKIEPSKLCPFYGRCLAFQFNESLQPALKTIAIMMAAFSEVYYNENGMLARANTAWNCSKYMLNPELRARRIVNVIQYSSIEFYKAFLFLGETELLKSLPNLVSPAVAINRLIAIPSKPFLYLKPDGQLFELQPPSCHIGPAALNARLIAKTKREGMLAENPGSGILPEPCENLIIHCHGGGFVSQSSSSHESYLRDWAVRLDIPILSIDYSLAPRAPYPRAMEELLFAYIWALSNAAYLGSTAKRVIMAGDSAGGNLSACVALKCIEMGFRIPDSLFLAYFPCAIAWSPTPARFLSLIDPLIPLGFMTNCLKAYACSPDIYQDSLYEYKLKNIAKPKDGTNEGFIEEVESSEEALELIQDTNDDSQSVITPVEEVIMAAHERRQSRRFSTILTETAENISSAITTTFITLTGGTAEEDISDSEDALNEVVEETPLPIDLPKLPEDPFLSPYFANDDLFKQLPPIHIVTVHMDPCLDDCVMFAKRLKELGKKVNMDILKGLPHGFLNLAITCKEAHEGSVLCAQRIADLFKEIEICEC